MDFAMNRSRAFVSISFMLAIVLAPPTLSAEEAAQWNRSVLPIQQKPFAGIRTLLVTQREHDQPIGG